MPTPEYVTQIRAKIGHDLLLLPSVAVLPRDAEGRLLLVRHAHDGSWGVAGGIIEPDESPAQAAVREVREEAGIEVRLGRLIGAFGGPHYRFTYPNGDRCSIVNIVYDAEPVGGHARPDGDETTDVGWFHDRELAGLELCGFCHGLLVDAGVVDA